MLAARGRAPVVKWYHGSFPSCECGFDSRRALFATLLGFDSRRLHFPLRKSLRHTIRDLKDAGGFRSRQNSL
jgi:hypothetical protein